MLWPFKFNASLTAAAKKSQKQILPESSLARVYSKAAFGKRQKLWPPKRASLREKQQERERERASVKWRPIVGVRFLWRLSLPIYLSLSVLACCLKNCCLLLGACLKSRLTHSGLQRILASGHYDKFNYQHQATPKRPLLAIDNPEFNESLEIDGH